jgi:SAM-dependent methyltransferase
MPYAFSVGKEQGRRESIKRTKESHLEHEFDSYLMEHGEETSRLERKTEPSDLVRQARWCGIGPGQRILDVCCGPGKTTAILRNLVDPDGVVVGVDASPDRIAHAQERYGAMAGIQFAVHDVRCPLNGLDSFDGAWVRFVLEYFRRESGEIVRNIAAGLKPGGYLYLIDLDYNCLSHHELPPATAEIVPRIMQRLEEHHNFDPYVGRKLYSYLYDLGFKDIEVNVTAHHVIYGKLRDVDGYNWIKKVEVIAPRLMDIFEDYPGGYEAFLTDFRNFFNDPRRFTYSPLILCKGRKP